MARRDYDVDDEGVGERLQKHTSGAGTSLVLPSGLPLFKPKKTGPLSIEVIPYHVTEAILKYPEKLRFTKPGKWYPERTYYVHFGVGPNNDRYICPAATFGTRCPICDVRSKYTKSPNKEHKDIADDLKPKEWQLFLIVDNDNFDAGIQLWNISAWNFGKNVDRYIEASDPQDRPSYKRYYHPIEGYTLRLQAVEETSGKNKYTDYTVYSFRDRTKPLPDDLFDHGYDLDTMPREVSYAQLYEAFHGAGGGEAFHGAGGGDAHPEDNGRAPREEPERMRGRATVDAEPPRTRPARDDFPGGDGYSDPPPRRRAAPEPEQVNTDRRVETDGRRVDNRRDEDDAPPPRRSRAPEPEAEPEPRRPRETADAPFRVDDQVEYVYRDKVIQGTVVEVMTDKRICKVDHGTERPATVDFEDLKLVTAPKAETTKAADPEPPPRQRRPTDWDDADDDRSFRRQPAKKAEEEPAPRGRAAARDDDPPPATTTRRAARPAEEEDEQPPRGRSRR